MASTLHYAFARYMQFFRTKPPGNVDLAQPPTTLLHFTFAFTLSTLLDTGFDHVDWQIWRPPDSTTKARARSERCEEATKRARRH